MRATEYLQSLASCLVTLVATPLSIDDALEACSVKLRDVRLNRGTVHLVGNGGSASVVSHAHNDFVKACHMRAMVYQDAPMLTAYANDHGYARGYANALSVFLDPSDVLIAVSSSGVSPNILNAARAANGIGATIVTLTGFHPDNPLRQLGTTNFYVPSSDYGKVELTHAALLHCLTDRLTYAG